MFRTALRILMNREDAEDAVQDTMLKLWQRRGELSDVRSLEALALTMVRNHALDLHDLAEKRNVSLDEQSHDVLDIGMLTPHERMVEAEDDQYVQSSIASLPEKQRTILQLRDVEGRSYREIAQILSISESDVKVTLFRTRTRLKQLLQQRFGLSYLSRSG